MSDSTNTKQNRLTDVCSIDYDALKSTFDLLKASSSPSSLQGELCGYLCAGYRFEPQQWLDQVIEFLHLTSKPDQPTIIQFIALKVNTQTQLESHEFEFDLVLPSDEAPIEERLDALAQWCMGFLTAFALADGHSKYDDLSDDAKGAFSDFEAISQASIVDGDETNGENDLFSVQEHVKMGTLMIFMELNSKTQQSNSQTPTLN